MAPPGGWSRPTRRLKRPAHPDGHRCGVPQFAGVLSVQGPDALHNGGRLGAAPHTPVDEKAGEDVAQSAVGPGQPEPPLPGLLLRPAVVTQTPLCMTVTQLSFLHCASPSHKGIVPA